MILALAIFGGLVLLVCLVIAVRLLAEGKSDKG